MAYETHYLIDRRVILTRLYDNLSPEDSAKFNQRNIELTRQGADQVHIIFDITDLRNIDLNIRQMLGLMSFTREAQLGWVIIVGGPQFAKFMGTIVLQAGGVNHRFVTAMNDAYTTLQHLEPDLLFS